LRTYGATLAEKTGTDINDRVFPLLEIVVKYLIWFAALLLLLDNFEIDITPILAGAGIAGIAIALAAQDILSNFFGGAIITVDQPFKIGDRIMFENHFGDIISIGPRSTRLKTLDNLIVTIPNSKLTSNIVINYAQPDVKMKVRIPFSVAYGSDIQRVKEILMEIAAEAAEKTSWVLKDPAPSVYFLEFAESSLNGQLIVWTNNYDNSWDVKDFINSQIDEQFKNRNIEIPFRQVDLHIRSQRGC
jgi:small-conductance mechanosensitive channel